MSETPKKLNKKEIAWYVIASIIGLLGLIFIVFGIIGSNFPGKFEDNWVVSSENAWLVNWSHLGYRWWGVILIAVAAFIASVSLTFFAKEGDRDSERALRRQQRLAMITDPVVEEQPETVDNEMDTPKN